MSSGAPPLRVGLCLLTWNEIAGCRHDVPLLPRDAFDEVFAIDGGSTDGTVEFLESQHVAVHPQQWPSYNGAYLTAFTVCQADALVFFHPKGSVSPSDAVRCRDLLRQGHDLVIASRIISGGINEEDVNWLKPRKWFVMGLGLLVALRWRREGTMMWDVLHGFRGMRKTAFFRIGPRCPGVSMDIEMVVGSYRQRLRRIEFPVHEGSRLGGATHFNALPTGARLLRYVWSELWR